jgi:hypothetical protein
MLRGCAGSCSVIQRRLAFGRLQRAAEDAGTARENKTFDAGGHCLLEQIQCAGDIGVDKLLARMGGYVRLVQGRGVQHDFDAAQAVAQQCAICNGPDYVGKG